MKSVITKIQMKKKECIQKQHKYITYVMMSTLSFMQLHWLPPFFFWVNFFFVSFVPQLNEETPQLWRKRSIHPASANPLNIDFSFFCFFFYFFLYPLTHINAVLITLENYSSTFFFFFKTEEKNIFQKSIRSLVSIAKLVLYWKSCRCLQKECKCQRWWYHHQPIRLQENMVYSEKRSGK